MIKYLQSKKGFTLIELIVVLAILAVMMAITLPNINTRKAKISEANSTATDFYAACQSVFSKLSMFEGHLSPAYKKYYDDHSGAALGIMGYYASMGGNYPVTPDRALTSDQFPIATDIYMELHTKSDRIQDITVMAVDKNNSAYANGFASFLVSRTTCASREWCKAFSSMMSAELGDRIEYRDGYYYAKISFVEPPPPTTITEKQMADTVKVKWTAYTRDRLPDSPSELTSYENSNLMFGDDYVLPNGNVCGTCAAWNTSTGNFVGLAGTILK